MLYSVSGNLLLFRGGGGGGGGERILNCKMATIWLTCSGLDVCCLDVAIVRNACLRSAAPTKSSLTPS